MLTPRTGMRVVLRYTADGQPTDALGTVTAADEAGVTVDTRRGPVTVARADILLVHEVPPAPQRPGRLHAIVSPLDLRRIAAQVWLPADIAWLHADNLRHEAEGAGAEVPLTQTGVLLRAAGGVSKRGNSALPLGRTGIPAAEALELVTRWYEQRGLPPQLQIYSGHGTTALAEPCAELGPLLRGAGFVPSGATLALTAATREVAGAVGRAADAALPGLEIVESEEAHAVHWTAWGHPVDAATHADFARLVTSPEQHRFYSALAVHPDGSRSLVGTVRLAITQKWAVVSNLVVDPGVRRRGAGRALVIAAAAAAAERGVRSLLAEVEADNAASLALFTALGATEHHRYWYALRS